MRLRSGLAAAILLGTHWGSAAELGKLVPVRWPGGPLEVVRRRAVKPLPAELAAALQDWYQPWSLDLLRDTPVNCVLVTWSGGTGLSVEREQRRIVRQYVREAHAHGITVMVVLPEGSTPGRNAADAADAGLDGLVVEQESAPIPQPASSLPLPVVALSVKAATAPGVRVLSKDGAAQATPTSEPWIDSNLWLVRFLRARGQEPAWLGYTFEDASDNDYVRAIADAAIAGGRWVVAPDDRLMAGLAARKGEAESCWRRIVAALRFFEEHARWRQFLPIGPLAIVQDGSATAMENLNLIARRKIPYRLLERPALSGAGLAGLRAVLATGIALSEPERAAMLHFAQDGGLAIAGPALDPSIPQNEENPEVQAVGKGRVAVYREPEPDPESLSKDVLHLIGKDNLGIRLFHAITVLPVVGESPDRRQLSIGLVNYATEPADAVMVRLTGEYGSARLYGLDSGPVALELEKSERGTELKVAKVPIYAVLVLEKKLCADVPEN